MIGKDNVMHRSLKRSNELISRIVLTSVFLTLIPGVTFAADTPGYEIAEAEIAEAPRVRDLIDDYLSSKGWGEGPNIIGSGESARSFFVAVGVGTIAARRDSPGYVSSRSNAFQKAFIGAQRDMVQFLESEVSASVQSSYLEPSSARETQRIDKLVREGMALQAAKAQVAALSADVNEYAEYESTATAATQAERLLRHELNKKLIDAGFDPSQPVEGQQLASILSTEEFKSAARIVANSRVAGMQAFKTFEVLPNGNQGQIGVVAIYSERLHGIANALYTGSYELVPDGAPRKPLKQQIPLDESVLLSTFGVTAKVDENGQLALVAFGQAGARTDSSRSITAAERKARTAAIQQIRFFAGSMVRTLETVEAAESMTELSSGTIDVVTDDSYEEAIKVSAESLNISGLKTIHRWDARHPVTGHYIAGIVVSWSPENARIGQQLKGALNADLNGGSGSPKDANADSLESGKAGSLNSEGVEGSMDF